MVNSLGRQARLGSTGKYYCGGEGCSDCCNGGCGPTNGCNCEACMALDIKARSLPKGDLVNKEGHACRISTQTSKMYCGASYVGYCNTEGYCEPLYGENCKACKIV